jgi:hypothetical protein
MTTTAVAAAPWTYWAADELDPTDPIFIRRRPWPMPLCQVLEGHRFDHPTLTVTGGRWRAVDVKLYGDPDPWRRKCESWSGIISRIDPEAHGVPTD